MNALAPFAFDEHPVRIVDRAGQPWFVLADVCRILELANVGNAAARLAAGERSDIRLPDATGRDQLTAVVNEPGLYRLIFRSRKPAAERFSAWVTNDVLPQIRSTGSYGHAASALDLSDPAVLHRLLLDHTGRSMATEQRVSELEPKADALARLADAQGSLCVTDAAKALAVPPRRLFAWLEANSWIYRRSEGGPWVAFEAKRQAGVVEHKGITIEVRGRPDRWIEQVMITPKGLARLAEVGAGR